MKKRSLQFISALLVIMLLALTVSCGGSAPSTTTASTDTAKTETAKEEAPAAETKAEEKAETPAAASGDKVKITMTSWANTGEIAVLSKAVDRFNEIQSEIEVEFHTAPGEGYDQNLITSLAGGTAQDVFYAGESTVSKLIKNGTIAVLNDFMEGPDSYCKISDFADGLWGAARSADGKIYGITVDCNPTLLYYSPKMFSELGIKDPWDYIAEGKWNFDAFDETVAKLVDNGKKGFVIGADNFWLYNWMFSNGGTMWNGDTYKYDDKSLEAFKYLADRVKDGRFVYSGSLPKGQGGDALFLSGQVGYVTAGRWYSPTFHDAGVDYEYAPYPSNTGSEYPPIWIATAYMCVNNNSKNIDAAKKFATFYCSTEGQKIRLGGGPGVVGNAVPSISGIDDAILESGEPKHIEVLFKVREAGWANGGTLVQDGKYATMHDDLLALTEEIFVNGKTVDEIAPQMEAKVAELVAAGN